MRRDCHFTLLCVIAFWCVVGALVRGRGAGVRAGAGPGAGSRLGAVLAQFWRKALVRGCRFSGDFGAGVTPAKETLLSI